MADSRQQEFARLAAQGDVEAKSRFLIEKVRSGELNRERIELAAYLGDPASCLVLIDEDVNPDKLDRLNHLGKSIQYMNRWGKETVVRASSAAAEDMIDFIEKEDPGFDLMHTAVQAIKAWIGCPGKPQTQAVREATDEIVRLEKVPFHRVNDGFRIRDLKCIFDTVFHTCCAITLDVTFYAANSAGMAAESAASILPKSHTDSWIEAAYRKQVWKTICDALIPWALGEGDPFFDMPEGRR